MVLEYLAHAALHRQPAQQLEDDVLGGDPGLQLSRQPHADDLGRRQVVGAAAHGDRHVQAAGAYGQHAGAAGRRRVAVRAQQQVAGGAEALQVYLVADAVPRPREVDPVLGGHGLEEAVVVRVLEARLEHVVVDVGDGEFGPHLGDAHRLELEVRHRAGGVLGERLVDADADLGARLQFAGDEVVSEDLSGQVLAQVTPPLGDG